MAMKPGRVPVDGGAGDAEFLRGWSAALESVSAWHTAQAKQTMIQSTRTRFPKSLERDAEVHRRAAEMVLTLSPDDV